jgi:putative nucleotidyltransferase with HDIG domain
MTHISSAPSVLSVLIVDDEPGVRDIMCRWVTSFGLQPQAAANAEEALAALDRHPVDLAVIDVMMPGHDGLWLANRLRLDHPQTAVVVATAYSDLLGADAEQTPIADLLIKPFKRERFALALERGRQWRKEASGEVRWHAQLVIELEERRDEIAAVLRQQDDPSMEAVALADLLWVRSPDVMAHGERVARYVQAVGRELALDEQAQKALELAARYHDVGKAALPESLLTKPSPLTDGEFAIIRKHVEVGADILASTRSLNELAPIVRATHERFGGGGYPHQLAGDAIPLASRIISVADAYDAMTQTREYRVRIDSSQAVSELLRCGGSQFDPAMVTTFLSLLARH